MTIVGAMNNTHSSPHCPWPPSTLWGSWPLAEQHKASWWVTSSLPRGWFGNSRTLKLSVKRPVDASINTTGTGAAGREVQGKRLCDINSLKYIETFPCDCSVNMEIVD